MAADAADLEHALRDEDFAVAIPLAERLDRRRRRRRSTRTRCRGTCSASAAGPSTGSARRLATAATAAAAVDDELDAFLHLWALNRGILLTPFHNMALLSPATPGADVDRHTEVFAEALAALTV